MLRVLPRRLAGILTTPNRNLHKISMFQLLNGVTCFLGIMLALVPL